MKGKENSTIYPNPAKSTFKIKLNSSSVKVTIADASGKLVKEFSEIQENYDIASLKAGVYFVTIKTESGTETKKLIKQ